MCYCEKPNINGQPGYCWNDRKYVGTHPVDPPDISEGDILLHDEPGRCGEKTDSHSHHYRVVRRHGRLHLLVRHGAGDECIDIRAKKCMEPLLASLDSNARYWLLNSIYHCQDYEKRDVRNKLNEQWRQAAAEKRIKTKKVRGMNAVKVWIEEKKILQPS